MNFADPAPPPLSIVIAASDSAEAVARCLASLGPPSGFEVLVVAATDRIAPRPVIAGVTWILAPPGSGVPTLRGLGLRHARGEFVAFTEDSCHLDPGWAASWMGAFRDPQVRAATGPVDHEAGPATTAWDWAVFFCEYAPFLGPPRPGPPSRLAGNNFAARAGEVLALGGDELHESALAGALKGRGARMVRVEGAAAWHTRRFSARETIRDRLRYGLGFGRLRASSGRNPLVVLAGPAILLAQAGRVGFWVFAAGRHRAKFVEVLPITLAALAAWSVGEWLGWMTGRAARGISRARRPDRART